MLTDTRKVCNNKNMKKKKEIFKLTRKQISYISGRGIETVNNWINKRAIMPEHIESIKEEIEKFIYNKKEEIRRYESDEFKRNN